MSKDIREFLKLLNENKLEEIVQDANDLKLEITLPLDTKERVDKFYRNISIYQTRMFIQLLTLYHDWVNSEEQS